MGPNCLQRLLTEDTQRKNFHQISLQLRFFVPALKLCSMKPPQDIPETTDIIHQLENVTENIATDMFNL